MNGTLAVTRYTLIELSRRRILLVFFIIGAVGIALLGGGVKIFYSAIVQGTTQGSTGPNGTPLTTAEANQLLEFLFVSELLSVLGVFALLIAFALGMTAIYHDLDSGAAVSIFSKPVSRLAFTVGKLLGAVIALVAVVGALALEARLVMYLFGGGLENALWLEVLAQVANTLVLMLLVLALSTWMNNIVAAVVAFIYYNVVAGAISFIHTLAQQGAIDNAIVRGIFDVLYWVVPHTLTSSALHDLAQAEIELASRGGSGGTNSLSSIPPASGVGDVVWWAFVVVVLCSLVYYSVRRRQV